MKFSFAKTLASTCSFPLLLCASIAHAAPNATAVAIGDTKHPDTLPQELQAAYVGGARIITIRPGTYSLPDNARTVFNLKEWRDTTISAPNVTLINEGHKGAQDLWNFDRCTNVTLEGATLSQTLVSHYQGRVLALGKNDAGNVWVDWKPDAGYPIPPPDGTKFPSGLNFVDAKTRLLKIGVGDYWSPPMTTRENGVFRIQLDQKEVRFEVGDWVVGRHGDMGFKVHLDSSRDCTLRNLTLLRNGFSPIREEGSGGGNHILGVKWALAPKPPGATEAPLVSGAADGLHSTGANPGPDIENCRFEGVILDDCFAIHGGYQVVKSGNGNDLIVEEGYSGLRVNEPARVYSDKGWFDEAKVTQIKDNGDKTSTVTVDKVLAVPADAKVKITNPLNCGPGYRIIGNRLGNTRSRGILVKADNGLIQNNVIEGCGQSAISIGPEYYWNEADYARNVTIENNILRGNGKTGWGGGAILIHGEGAMANKNIVIKNNRTFSNYQGEIQAEWTDGLTVTGNAFTGATAWPSFISPQPLVNVSHAANLSFSANSVQNASIYAPDLVKYGEGINPAPLSKDAFQVGAAVFPEVVTPNNKNLCLVGRWDKSAAQNFHSYWDGAYLRANFTGQNVQINLAAPTRLVVSIDDETPREIDAHAGVNDLNQAPLKAGTHSLLVGSAGQNYEVELRGLLLGEGGKILPVSARPIIEFVGDSITTGRGYAWHSGEMLNADHTQIAFSGRALTTGFGCLEDKAGLDKQYFALKNFNHLQDTPQMLWKFDYTPQIIVVNLGQNDQCGQEPQEVFQKSYANFLSQLRQSFPRAQLVALRPFGGAYGDQVKAAVQVLAAGGDKRVQFVDTTDWLQKDDFVDGIHPNAAGHLKVANRLVPLLKPLLNAK